MERGGRTLFALIVVGIASFGFSAEASSSDLPKLRSVGLSGETLVQAINRARVANGAPPLRVGPRLQRAARAHSRRMARNGSFDHGDWYRRLRRHGVRASFVGETIAWGVGSSGTPAGIVASWLASPPHRATMLDPGFRRVGVGIAVGTMDGVGGASVATADFAGS